jgi:hypothetical protein
MHLSVVTSMLIFVNSQEAVKDISRTNSSDARRVATSARMVVRIASAKGQLSRPLDGELTIDSISSRINGASVRPCFHHDEATNGM